MKTQEQHQAARERLKQYVKASRDKKKYAGLRQLAQQEPHELGNALGELHQVFSHCATLFEGMAEQTAALKQNLDLDEPAKTASLRDRVAARKNYAKTLRIIAEEQPEELGSALSVVLEQLDDAAAGIEALADNFGLELNVEGAEDAGDVAPEDMADQGPQTSDEVATLPPAVA